MDKLDTTLLVRPVNDKLDSLDETSSLYYGELALTSDNKLITVDNRGRLRPLDFPFTHPDGTMVSPSSLDLKKAC